MIKIKHLLDAPEPDDGARLWVEPIGLTKDLHAWCSVNHLLSDLGPPITVWRWFQEHPEGYEYFRAKYHEHLARGPKRRETVRQLAAAALQEDFTLLHQGDDPQQNSATALYEFLTEIQAYLQPE